ncbi:helix-turn-helix transcriptional regulator [Pedobacter sp. MC2016-15]|uniref:helix-turn-helix transcriptional regulator n=1 Tax=Pedobacter sp. MC2016-15 TaxID=2994473 RepID=UPI0022465EFD|nr:AraC family transcriptional regulator [Pedobacter sp. MC2016-15]MCX2478283.1 helix-turn-helix transcriptional regulator [Pedobacter sp. MC2016-15]
MKISVTDKKGSGIMLQFARAIGAKIEGRFFYIPPEKGEGYITGFSFGEEMRILIRNYYLKEQIELDRNNEFAEGQDDVIFILSGIFPSFDTAGLRIEQPNVFICKQELSSQLIMASHTIFRSITIAVSRRYLEKIFGTLSHPVVKNILHSTAQFAFETRVSSEMIRTATEMLERRFVESIESHYYRLKTEELLCHVFSLLIQREEDRLTGMHIKDIEAIYAVKQQLLSNLNSNANIARLAQQAGMSEPKLRKLFRQIFGKGIFEYYQMMRMQEAADLLRSNKFSVSEVGYRLGFSNMSHFSRVFEQHIGMKPKKYSAAVS